MKREQIYISDEFYAEVEKVYLKYKLGELQVPEQFKGKRLTKNVIYQIALADYFTKNHNFQSSPIEK